MQISFLFIKVWFVQPSSNSNRKSSQLPVSVRFIHWLRETSSPPQYTSSFFQIFKYRLLYYIIKWEIKYIIIFTTYTIYWLSRLNSLSIFKNPKQDKPQQYLWQRKPSSFAAFWVRILILKFFLIKICWKRIFMGILGILCPLIISTFSWSQKGMLIMGKVLI